MEQETPSNKDLALQFFNNERAGSSSSDELHITVQRIFEKLSAHLSKRLGSGGYHALLKRALMLSTAEFPWLALVHITENGLLEGVPVPGDHIIAETVDGCVAILAQLIELLDTFIGRKLCLRVLHSVWPDAVLTTKEGLQGDSNGQSRQG